MQGDFINAITDVRGTAANNFTDGKYAAIVEMYTDIYGVAGYMKTDAVATLAEVPQYYDRHKGFTVLVTDATPQYVLIKKEDCVCQPTATDCWYDPVIVGADAHSAAESARRAELAQDGAEVAAQLAAAAAQAAQIAEINAEASAVIAQNIADNLAVLDQSVGILEFVASAGQTDFGVWSEAEQVTVALNGTMLIGHDPMGNIDDYEKIGSVVRLTLGASLGDVVRVIGYEFRNNCLQCPPDNRVYPETSVYPSTGIYPTA